MRHVAVVFDDELAPVDYGLCLTRRVFTDHSRMAAPTSKHKTETTATSTPISDRGHLLTEQRLDASANLDALDVRQTLETINAQDQTVANVVHGAIGQITPLVEAIVRAMQPVGGGQAGRLIYIGAGTSGRLGVLDASECPPTFCCESQDVVGVIAGGDNALRESSEGKEDDPQGASAALDALKVGQADVVVGIAAGGTTPYVIGGLVHAKRCGAVTGMVTCVDDGRSVVGDKASSCIDHMIDLPVGPEVVTGSTRMKAGTATKLALNMITTATMVQRGKVWGNLMVDLRATNAKLRDRAARIIVSQTTLSRDAALAMLDEAGGRAKVALVMALRGVDAAGAADLLASHHQQLRPILGAPR